MQFETVVLSQQSDGTWSDLGQAVETAVAHLESGGLLAHPTTGVYGLGGARIPGVGESLVRIKERGPGSGFVYLISDAVAAHAEFPRAEWTDFADRLAEEFWPGALTLVLNDESASGVAIRAEAHPVTRAVLLQFAGAMSSTSLNRTGESAAVSSIDAHSVLRDLTSVDRPVLLLDVGPLPGPPPSTLVKVEGDTHMVLRQGAISAKMIGAVCA